MRAPALAALMACLSAAPALAGSTRPVVLELFTSEGCNSCPPADAVLSELAASGSNLLPLAFHVTYWDRLGWPDPFALPAATQRQHDYAAVLGSDSVYTPQMVVDGTHDVIGSDRAGVLRAVAQQRGQASHAVPVTLARSGGEIAITVASGEAIPANVLVAGYDSRHATAVKHGENAGRTLVESNVVRGLSRAGSWRGEAVTLRAKLPPGEHIAVLLQAEGGRILGAAQID